MLSILNINKANKEQHTVGHGVRFRIKAHLSMVMDNSHEASTRDGSHKEKGRCNMNPTIDVEIQTYLGR